MHQSVPALFMLPRWLGCSVRLPVAARWPSRVRALDRRGYFEPIAFRRPRRGRLLVPEHGSSHHGDDNNRERNSRNGVIEPVTTHQRDMSRLQDNTAIDSDQADAVINSE